MKTYQIVADATPVSFFLDATPLLDDEWTGIPIVCAQIARYLIASNRELDFTLGNRLVPRPAIYEALERHTGTFLRHEIDSGLIPEMPISWPTPNVSVGISTSVKRLRRYFDLEFSIIHDISTILQPHFHTPENVFWHTEAITEDLKSNHVTFCSSRSTLNDLTQYMGEDAHRLAVVYNAAEWPWWFPARSTAAMAVGFEPYIVVLATREPRKNNAVVFNLLSERPDLLQRYRFVFVGKDGWLLDDTGIPRSLRDAVNSGRIINSGYVSEYKKYLLLKGAVISIFPSLFEGFGLPILESISVGTPCVASFSSSMKEVGGDYCEYFDPYSPESLGAAFERAISAKKCHSNDEAEKRRKWVEHFSWASAVDEMLNCIYANIACTSHLSTQSLATNSVIDQ